MIFNLEKISNIDGQSSSIKSTLNGSYYNSTWDDPVHDSFGEFIDAYGKQIDMLSSLANQLSEACKSLESIDIDGINKKYSSQK
ncbi:MAG: hypothetical protein IJA82_01235 [Clostridia bacterium]|nr:hypothetical protein [Clostridia bacterium]